MTSPAKSATASFSEENTQEQIKDEISQAYKSLNEKCDAVLEKIQKRKKNSRPKK